MKALSTLIKLASAEVDEKRLALKTEQEREDALKAAIADLQASLAREQESAASLDEAALAYGAYGAAALRRREALERDLQQAQTAVEAARDALAVSYERQKRFEITEAGRRSRDAADARRRETIDTDERALQGHRRRR